MPTENRSSNTDPRDVFIRLNPLGLGEEELRKDSTGFEDQRTHSDYLMFLAGYRETHAEPQPHPEPIAWMVGTAFWWTKEEAERDAAATGLPMIPVGPMTGAGDIGLAREMLRRALRREDKWAFLCSGRNKQIAELRAQLAERDALLARIVNSGALSSEQYEELEADCCAAVDVVNQIKRQAFREHVDKCAALSASAEPSAPTLQTINGHKLYCKAVADYKPGQCSCGVEIDHQIPGISFQRLNALANQGE
ncbi:hypothetical protein IE322_05495 [Pseudomonas asiatica]|uniref:hypothetical protein n=1 Tax=Pseudomonas asiatica TaxID=2219225 RepID=UPI0017496351|nr:hypothetical protein [Pseudomonas asiatica]QOE11051.1 hypothetical protein IE322_05495 [Pseudomonas asiatica]